MSRPRRLALIAAASVAALYAVAALVVPWIVDADRFRPRVESRLTEALGRKVVLTRLRLSLWAGVALVGEGLEIREPGGVESGSGFRIAAGRVSVRPAIFPLLRGDVRLRSVALTGGTLRSGERVVVVDLAARIRLGREPDGAARLAGHLSGTLRGLHGAPVLRADFDAGLEGDTIRLSSFRAEAGAARLAVRGDVEGIVTGRLRFSFEGGADFGRTHAEGSLVAEGLAGERPEIEFDVTSLRVDFDEMARLAGILGTGSPSAGLLDGLLTPAEAGVVPAPSGFLARAVCRGTIKAASGRIAGLELTALSASVLVEKGSARFENAAFALFGGRCVGSFEADLNSRAAPFRLAARLDGVDADRLLSGLAPARGGALHGIASVTLDVAGEAGGGGVARTVRGAVRAELKGGKLLTVGILKQVAQLVEMAGGRGIGRDETPFDHLSASFDVLDGRGETKNLEFRSPDLDLDGGGAVGLDGSLRLDVTASFSRQASADLVRETPQLKFRIDPGGRLTMPLKIRGDLKTPLVQLDLDRVLREGLERSTRDRGRKGFLRRLFGGN